MTFKRSAVRSRLSPPWPERKAKNSFLKRNEFLLPFKMQIRDRATHALARGLYNNVEVNYL